MPLNVEKVLIVEDEVVVASALTRLFVGAGHTVVHVVDVASALRELAVQVFDVVVTDYRLGPRGSPNGGELLLTVSRDYPRMRRVLFSGEQSVPPEQLAAAHVFVSKTAFSSDLLTAISGDSSDRDPPSSHE